MPRRQPLVESSDEDSYDSSEMSEEQLDISEVWTDFVSKINDKGPDGFALALSNLAECFDYLASSPDVSKENEEDIKKVFEEREKLVQLVLTTDDFETFECTFDALSLILISARHAGFFAPREEYVSLLNNFQRRMKDSHMETKSGNIENVEGSSGSGDESSDDLSISESKRNSDTLSLILLAARGEDIAWLYNEHLRTKLVENGWDEGTMNMFRGFFKVLAQYDYEEPDREYKVSLILEDMIKLIEYISSNGDLPEDLIGTGLDIVEEFIDTFIDVLREEDIKKILEGFLKLMQSANVVSNNERKEKIANIACSIGDSYCVCATNYEKDIFDVLSRFIEDTSSSPSLRLFLQISEALFPLLDKRNEEDSKLVNQILGKCLDSVEDIQASYKDAEKGESITLIHALLNTISIGIKVVPYSEEIATKFINILKIDNIRYPRRVTRKTSETLLHEMCGGFLAKISSKDTNLYFCSTGINMPVLIAKTLITILERIPASSTSFKGVDGNNGTGVSFKGIINYSRHLSEASNLYNDDVSSAALELASIAINKSNIDIWKGVCNVKDEWTSVRRMFEIAYEGCSGCQCDCDESCCDECEGEEDEAVTLSAIKHLVKSVIRKEMATTSQMDMMLVKMRIPKLKGFDSFDKVERSLIVFMNFYLECLRNGVDLDSGFFKTNVLFFIDKFIKDYESDYKQTFNQLKKEYRKTADELMEIKDVEMALASINGDADDIALLAFHFLEIMCKMLKMVPESKRKQLEEDIGLLDASTKRLIESSVTNHNGMSTMVSCVLCCQNMPDSCLSTKYILDHAPKSVSDLREDKCAINKLDVSDYIEYLGAIVESCASCENESVSLFRDLLKKYHNVLVYDPNVLENVYAHRFTHFPLLIFSLRKGEEDKELWETTIEEIRNLRSADTMLYVANKISKLPDAQKEMIKSLKSKERFKEVLKFIEGVAIGVSGKKNKEMLENVRKLREFLE